MPYRTAMYDPELLRPIVFRIYYSPDQHGTGFLVSPDGWALSCWHVIPLASVIDPVIPVPVEWPWHSERHAPRTTPSRAYFHKELSSREKDIAVLKFDPLGPDESFPTLPLAALAPGLLRDRGVCVRGFQEADRRADSVEVFGSTNRHNAVRPIRIAEEGGAEVTQWLLVIDPQGRNIETGASGGPMVDTDSGHIIAIATGQQRGAKWGHAEVAAGRIYGTQFFLEEQYFPEGYAIPFYEVCERWPDFRRWCQLVGDVPVASTPASFSIGKYESLEEVGRGGFGTVFKVRHLDTGALVALKRFEPVLFRADEREEARQRFLRGAAIMQRLNHPHIPRVFEINTNESYFVMEFASGGNLLQFLKTRTWFGIDFQFETRVQMALQLCDAVAHAHREGVLHRDISPSNVLVDDPETPVPRLWLSDFDLAFQRGRTQLTGREWNWHYYLPRDLRTELDNLERLRYDSLATVRLAPPGISADLYSLAMVILYMFSGLEPGPEGVVAEIERLRQTGRAAGWCSMSRLEHLAQTLERALSPLVERRFSSAEQLSKELAYLLPPRVDSGADKVALIEEGPFFMGSDDNRFPDECPRHLVRVSSFRLDRYLVTNADYQRFLDDEANADWRPGGVLARLKADANYLTHWQGHDHPPEALQNYPVVYVSWHAAYAYVGWAAGKGLPSEAEWEYAARAGTDTAYWWGDQPDPHRANFFRSRKRGPTPVGLYSPNDWGLFDMLGNVAEWCADWYTPDCYRTADNDHNPRGPLDGDERVIRGGAYDAVADDVRCSARNKAGPRLCSNAIGFRCRKAA